MNPRVPLAPCSRMLAMIVVAALSGSVHAVVLNVQILGHASNSKGGPDETPPAYRGAGIIGAEGDYWNGVKAEAYGQPLMILRPRKLFTADGKTLAGVKLKFSGFIGADHWPAGEGAPVNNALLNSYLVSGAGASVTIERLVPDSAYDLCVFGNNSHAGAGAKFAVNGGAPRSTQGTQGAVFSKEVDYVEFKGVTADKQGRLRISLDAVDPASSRPASSTVSSCGARFPARSGRATAGQKFLGGQVMAEADDLARAGLKSGDPVTQWKDAFQGIRFGRFPCHPTATRFRTTQRSACRAKPTLCRLCNLTAIPAFVNLTASMSRTSRRRPMWYTGHRRGARGRR